MKRFTLIVALVLLAAMPMFAEHVDSETARKVAATFLNNNGAKATQLTDISKAAGFPNLYIFTTEEGFVVMSADDCVKPILGYSLTGDFDVEDMPDNVRVWLKGYSNEIQYAINSKMSATTETIQLWKALAEGKGNVAKTDVVVAPLIQTKWNQNKYYNNLCPSASGGPNGHAYTGCVATAMAQIMKYWGYPSHGIGSHSYAWNGQTLSADFGSTTYDWENMGLYYEYYYSDANANSGSATSLDASYHTTEKVEAVATLMYHCGVSVDMGYSGGGSGAITAYVANALKTYFNYSSTTEYKTMSSYSDSEWKTMVKAELDGGRPLEYAGQDPDNPSSGHAFVCDGYDDADYFHFNWGWAGHYDGYFSLSNLNTGANSSEAGAGNGVYTKDQAAIFGIQPVQCAADEPTNLTYSLTGIQNLTLNWNIGTNANSYNVYRNGNLVGNTTENSYTETAPFGTNVYFVRSVDAEGNQSLSSNTISIFVGYQTPNVDDLTATLSDNSVSLSWTAPDWCYPETPSETLNYGCEDPYYSWTSVYYAHRHLASALAQYTGKAVYKVSTLIQYPGNYSLFVYSKSTSGDQPDPNSLAANINQVPVAITNDWYEFVLSEPIILTGTDDLWVVIKQENTGQQYPTPSFNLSEHNTNAFYSGQSSTSLGDANSSFNCAWFINTYLTDGTYTYNLYDNGIKLNGETPISDTNYTIENIENNTIHNYTVKTNYYGGESEASNTASLTLGSNTLEYLTLENNDNMTIGSGSTLTVNGTLSNTNPENLVIEDGAQLIHNSDGVAATVKKDIAAWTTEPYVGGWYFIASPINSTELAPDNVDNMLTDANEENGLRTYDLYRLENDNWKNYRKNAFNLANGEGYLYANESPQTLSFKGEIKPYDAENNSVTISAGWNLIGNPFTRNVVPSLAYHTLNNGSSTTSVMANGGLVTPGMGIAVYSENGGTLNFNLPSESSSAPSNGNLQITLNQQITNRNNTNTIAIDNTIVSFNESEGLPKFPLLEANSKLYIPKGNEEYAIVSSAAQGEMPINFKANENGIYTLTVNPENVEMNYLHLIDNLTGNDIDLLISPDYTFEAKTTDYAMRFRLVFASLCEDTDDDNEKFVFINDGNIIVYKAGTLQVVDMTGRVVYQGDAINRVSTSRMTPGVYVLRLITTNGVKTQKIVID